MSLTIKIKISTGSETTEGEVTVPLENISANIADLEINKDAISKVTSRFVNNTSSAVIASDFTPLSTLEASSEEATETVPPLAKRFIYTTPEGTGSEGVRDTIMVTVLSPSGTSTGIEVRSKATVGHVKAIYHRVTPGSEHASALIFFYGGKHLGDELSLEEQKIEDGDTILLGEKLY